MPSASVPRHADCSFQLSRGWVASIPSGSAMYSHRRSVTCTSLTNCGSPAANAETVIT